MCMIMPLEISDMYINILYCLWYYIIYSIISTALMYRHWDLALHIWMYYNSYSSSLLSLSILVLICVVYIRSCGRCRIELPMVFTYNFGECITCFFMTTVQIYITFGYFIMWYFHLQKMSASGAIPTHGQTQKNSTKVRCYIYKYHLSMCLLWFI